MTILAELPPIKRFPTVDEIAAFATELAEKHPDRVTLSVVGSSRQGDPIQLLSIEPGVSKTSVLVVGQPHPNEPIGMATITTLCQRLLAQPDELDRIGASWHFIPCVDPDGTRLNEGWFAGPWTREHYSRHFYRPAGDTQVEWTFPFSSGGFSVNAPMPETRALMAAIDRVKPEVMASLHNAELGGAYFYTSRGAPELYEALARLCADNGVPLHLGTPETPLSYVLAPAVFTVPTAQQIYDFAISAGLDPADLISGASSLDHAERHGPVIPVVIELPYWRDARAADQSPLGSGESRRSVVLRSLELEAESVETLRGLLDATPDLPPSPFSDAVRGFLALHDGGADEMARREAETDPAFERTATVAEAFSSLDNVRLFRLRMSGMLLRANPAGSPGHAAAERLFTEWCEEAAADDQAEAIAIETLVAIQAGAILAAVDEAQR